LAIIYQDKSTMAAGISLRVLDGGKSFPDKFYHPSSSPFSKTAWHQISLFANFNRE